MYNVSKIIAFRQYEGGNSNELFQVTLRVSLPVARVAVRVPCSTVFMSVILFIPLPFVPATVFTGLTGVGFWRTTFLPSFVAGRPAVVALPTWGRHPLTANIATGWWRARAVAAVGSAVLAESLTVITITVITRLPRTSEITKNSNGLATKFLSIELLHSTVGVLTGQVLQDTFTDVVAIYVGERNRANLTTEILEILLFGKYGVKVRPSWVGIRKPIRIPTARTAVPSPKRAEIIRSRVKLL